MHYSDEGKGMAAPATNRAEGRLVRTGGELLLGGFLLNAVVTMLFHPAGEEDDHEAIFAEYADSEAWVAVHLGQFVGVIVALAGLLVLCWALRELAPQLSLLAAGAAIATTAGWAVLQAVDGVALKQTVDAWVDAGAADEATRFADAETVRWIEWAVQSYVRVLFGITMLLIGVAFLRHRFVAAWIGWCGVAAGGLSLVVGVDVGFSGLESDFQQIAGPLFQVAVLALAVGVVLSGLDRPRALRPKPG